MYIDNYFEIIIWVFISYLIGSLSFSCIIGKMIYGIDVRKFGSGNAGATNTARVLGKKMGLLVLVLDALKGFVAVTVISLFNDGLPTYFYLVCGVACLVGHIFPIFFEFKGGKGVATTLGVLAGVDSYLMLLAVLVFVLTFIASKIVSLSSILSAITIAITTFILPNESIYTKMFMLWLALLFIITHHENISRLIKKEEKKFSLNKKTK